MNASRHQRKAVLSAAALFGVVTSGAASAQNSIHVGSVVANPGEGAVVVPIEATTTVPLTLLSLDLTFDRSLCSQIRNQVVPSAGRTSAEVQEGGVKCPDEGRIRVVLLNLTGAAVIPPGDGEIMNWRFDVVGAAPGGVFPLGLTLIQASNGPIRVPLTVSGGGLTINGSPMTTATLPAAATPTLTVPPVVMPTPTMTRPVSCAGDCDGDGQVNIDELLRSVQIGLGIQDIATCPVIDRNRDGTAGVPELVEAVGAALHGCGGAG